MYIKFDKAVLSDLDKIYQIEVENFVPQEVLSRETYKERIEKISSSFIVARDELGKVMGFIVGKSSSSLYLEDEVFTITKENIDSDPYYWVVTLAVDKECQKFKIGSRLIQNFLEQAKSEGKKAVSLTCVKELVTYYEKFNFKNHGVSESKFAGHTWYNMVFEF
ncbi:GNAT family N-acetyltransferase [Spiroplasma chinense]|uniref:GNAT family N-acetyltransferase n=1 Tax=Spiroplasma chinense TaxID=216932 RepID=A0A5B9Y6A5_9MOLU|nr:GNAT family N-acetyltransferase [Spiroplasma chinense]QEH62353.1 GNAT family N-acetyltransferase [Spiroplasma chinense]